MAAAAGYELRTPETTMSENSFLSLTATLVIGLAILVGWCAGGAASDFVEAHRIEFQGSPRTVRIPLATAAQPLPAKVVRAAPPPSARTRREVPAPEAPANAPQFEAKR